MISQMRFLPFECNAVSKLEQKDMAKVTSFFLVIVIQYGFKNCLCLTINF